MFLKKKNLKNSFVFSKKKKQRKNCYLKHKNLKKIIFFGKNAFFENKFFLKKQFWEKIFSSLAPRNPGT